MANNDTEYRVIEWKQLSLVNHAEVIIVMHNLAYIELN